MVWTFRPPRCFLLCVLIQKQRPHPPHRPRVTLAAVTPDEDAILCPTLLRRPANAPAPLQHLPRAPHQSHHAMRKIHTPRHLPLPCDFTSVPPLQLHPASHPAHTQHLHILVHRTIALAFSSHRLQTKDEPLRSASAGNTSAQCRRRGAARGLGHLYHARTRYTADDYEVR